jgi:mediator of RNA polymerase II transcription subunit 12
MTSRPGPGIQESLQHRGGGSAYLPGRWATNPQHGDPDPAAEGERGLAEARVTKARPKGKPVPLDAIQTTAVDRVRPTPRGAPQLFFSNAPPGENELPAQRQLLTNLPVPPRPGPSAPSDVLQQRRIVPGGTGVKDGAATEPQGIDAPAPALVFPAGSKLS